MTSAELLARYELSIVELTLRLKRVRDAHGWQCDCTPDDPCRVYRALVAEEAP